MSYDSIKRYDVGLRGNNAFPAQYKMAVYKPLLSEVIDSLEAYIKKNRLKPVRINVEIKSDKDEYGLSQPQPTDFVALVMGVIESKKFSNRINIQSFDPEILNIMHKKYPLVKTAYLTDNPGIDNNLSMLVFTPDIYSPHYKLVNHKFLDSLHSKNMRVIPWTVNDDKDIDAMLALKVDGIITDYPERVIGK
jgi:glycerophosphoryl diester phosphodiesterase